MSHCEVIQWSDVYNIGYEKIDDEHKKLFLLASNVLKCEEDGEKIKESIKELVKYTKFHFTNEEIYMRSIQYDKLDEHIKIHKHIVSNLQEFIKKLPTLEITQIYSKLIDFINNNLIQHILIEDKKVQHFRRDKKELRAIFTWKENYKLDQEMMDDEHHKLFDIAQEALCEEKLKANPKSHIKKTIMELYNYMKIHFENEEKFMEEINFPLIEEHKTSHEKIIIQMNNFVKQIPKLSPDEFERKLIEYMDIWLVNHIIFEDKKYQCFFETQNTIKYDLD